jgi:hypothetical protein
LSLTLGIPVGELRTRITSSEFAEYRAYYSAEPFGDLRADYRIGILASLVANLGIGEHDTPATPIDFVIHGDAKSGETVLEPKTGDQAEPDAEPDAELRRKSQQEQIDAIKRFTAARHRKG